MQLFFTNGNRGCQHQHPLPDRHPQGRFHSRLHPDNGNAVFCTQFLNRHRCRRITGDDDPFRPFFEQEAYLRIGIVTHLRLLLRSVRRMFRICIEQKSLPRQATHRFIKDGEAADSGVKNPNRLLFHLIVKVIWSFVSSYRQRRLLPGLPLPDLPLPDLQELTGTIILLAVIGDGGPGAVVRRADHLRSFRHG